MGEPGAEGDVRLCGHLRKQKSQRRRFFVLREPSAHGPARLEYYESEKKFGAGGARPKRSFPLAGALSVSKRADARHAHLVLLYGRDGTFGLAAESAAEQDAWYRAMVELRGKGLSAAGGGAAPSFQEVWQVTLRPKGLGQARNLAGVYRLCLADSTVELVRLGAPAPCLALQLLCVRRCGHSENFFFLEVGRSAATGPGELWMQADDPVVARHMHETILEAMKRLSEECRVRGRGLASAPVSVPAPRRPPGRRRPEGDEAPASSDEGGSPSPGEARPGGSPGERGPGAGYVAMLPGAALPGVGPADYVPMSPGGVSPPRGHAAGYVVMSPGGSWVPDYVNMGPRRRSPPPGVAPCPFRSLPPAGPLSSSSSSSSTSSESLGEPVPPSPGEYVSIAYRPGAQWGSPAWEEPGLNYVALDLARGGGGGSDGSPRAAGGPSPQAYASIDFHRCPGHRGGTDGPGC